MVFRNTTHQSQGWCSKTPGIIAKIKGYLRRRYSKWACDRTIEQLGNGCETSEVKIPSDVPTCKKNLFAWLSDSVAHFNSNEHTEGIVHCWDTAQLSRAWETSVRTRCESAFFNMGKPGGEPLADSIFLKVPILKGHGPCNDVLVVEQEVGVRMF